MNFKVINNWLILVAIAFMAGCGGGFDSAGAMQEVNATNAQRLANLYVQHQREKGGNGPKDEDAFRAYIDQVNPVLLERIGVDPTALGDLFNSERDGDPLKIRYGVRGNDLSSSEPIVFETVGVDGVRIVAFTGQKVEQVSDEADYQKLLEFR